MGLISSTTTKKGRKGGCGWQEQKNKKRGRKEKWREDHILKEVECVTLIVICSSGKIKSELFWGFRKAWWERRWGARVKRWRSWGTVRINSKFTLQQISRTQWIAREARERIFCLFFDGTHFLRLTYKFQVWILQYERIIRTFSLKQTLNTKQVVSIKQNVKKKQTWILKKKARKENGRKRFRSALLLWWLLPIWLKNQDTEILKNLATEGRIEKYENYIGIKDTSWWTHWERYFTLRDTWGINHIKISRSKNEVCKSRP